MLAQPDLGKQGYLGGELLKNEGNYWPKKSIAASTLFRSTTRKFSTVYIENVNSYLCLPRTGLLRETRGGEGGPDFLFKETRVKRLLQLLAICLA